MVHSNLQQDKNSRRALYQLEDALHEKTVNTFKNNIMFWVSIIYPGASFSTFRTLICREIADTSSTRLISPLTLAKGARTSMARLTVWISGAV